jgi:uncharacterized Fe-S center protein
MKSDVFLIKNNFVERLGEVLKKVAIESVEGKSVAIKLHMGEYGNLNYIRPVIVGRIVEIVKKFGGEPFLFETPTAYESTRDSPEKYLDVARKNGFTEETIGCPIIISNKGVDTKTDGKIGRIEVGKELYEADFLIVVSHSKGHCMCGYGGALKNLGIGCLTTKSKDAVHSELHPILVEERCDGSGLCEKSCKYKAISIEDNKAKIDYSRCTGCGDCVKACLQNAIKSSETNFQELIAEGSSSIIKKFKGNQIYINILFDITAECDCEDTLSHKEFPVCNDIGFLISKDPVAIENASIDLINKESGKNVFLELHKFEPKEIIDFAVGFNLGNKEYNLI